MAQLPSIPKGTRDFGPLEMAKRNYIFDTIREVFKLFGFQQIETPAMENLSTLLGKYGEEGDKLLFRILNSGDFFHGIDPSELRVENSSSLSNKISEKGLRYDLTVPFARFVVQHRDQITFPFRRFQIQPVWRADRPQKGRYREFYQCDADIIGSNSLLNEAELIQIIDLVFQKLGIEITIKINNRKVLAGIAEYIGYPGKLTDITIAIDKIDKIGKEKVVEELISKDIPSHAIEKLTPIFELEGTFDKKYSSLISLLKSSETGMKGLDEINQLFRLVNELKVQSYCELDLTLARGLNYYTGAIFEVKANGVDMGSISGGGRYDNLTGVFGMEGVSGVGISFGADRIYDVLSIKDLFPNNNISGTQVLFLNLGVKEQEYCLLLLNQLRKSGVCSEIYPDQSKFKKQIEYANKRQIPYVVIVGEDEMAKGMVSVKNMNSGIQELISGELLVSFFNK